MLVSLVAEAERFVEILRSLQKTLSNQGREWSRFKHQRTWAIQTGVLFINILISLKEGR